MKPTQILETRLVVMIMVIDYYLMDLVILIDREGSLPFAGRGMVQAHLLPV